MASFVSIVLIISIIIIIVFEKPPWGVDNKICTVWCGVVWCAVLCCGVMWCGVVWCVIVLHYENYVIT